MEREFDPAEYNGAWLLVGDRTSLWFVDFTGVRVAAVELPPGIHVLAFEGDSAVRWWEGNFSDYEADRRKRLGVDADQPHRIRYKPLTRN